MFIQTNNNISAMISSLPLQLFFFFFFFAVHLSRSQMSFCYVILLEALLLSSCLVSICCHTVHCVPPPCETCLRADVSVVPVNLAVFFGPIGNDTFHSALLCIPRQRFRYVSLLSQTPAVVFKRTVSCISLHVHRPNLFTCIYCKFTWRRKNLGHISSQVVG